VAKGINVDGYYTPSLPFPNLNNLYKKTKDRGVGHEAPHPVGKAKYQHYLSAYV